MRYKFIFIFCILLAANIINFAATPNDETSFSKYKVDALSFDRGISHQTVYDIFLDSKGFLWFGTMYGLVHYMGSDINVYRHDPNDKSTLSNDDVTKIFEDSKGRFWIATFGGGFNLLDIQNDSIKRYTPKALNLEEEWNGIVWDIKENNSGQIIIATDNYDILKLNPDEESVKHYSIIDSVKFSSEKKLYVDSQGKLFVIIEQNRLLRYDEDSDSFVYFSFLNLNLPEIRTIAQYEGDKFLLSSNENIIKYDTSTKQHEILNETYPALSSATYIRTILVDSKDNIWFGGYGNIYALNEKQNEVFHYSSKESKTNIFHGPVIDIVEDNNGVIWTGIYQGGINRIYQEDKIFSSVNYDSRKEDHVPGNKVNDIFSYSPNEIVLATNNGLSIFNTKEKTFENKFPGQSISTIAKDSSNSFWLGTRSGLLKCDYEFIELEKYTHNENELSISSNVIISLLVDAHNNLWVGTYSGLNKINLSTNEIEIFKGNPADPHSIKGNTILSLFEDKQGFIYAGTYNGLNKYDASKGKFSLHKLDPDDPNSISNNYVFAYLEDSKDNFWIGTGGGLNKFNKEQNSFSTLTEKDGLSNSVIYGIIEFNEHLFISTAEGLSVMNLNTGKINKFYQSHGLHGNMFSVRANCIDQNENIYMGGLNGFTIIDSEKYFFDTDEPKVTINSLSSIDKNFGINLAYKNINEITLPYNSNYVKIGFSTFDFRNTENISYKYRLSGFDSTWIESDGKPFAVYPQITPGEYSFSVKPIKSNGFEGTKTASLKLIVTPPFWQTYWFYTIVLLALALMVYIVHRHRVKTELRRQKEIEKIREEEEIKLRKKAADDFHDELGHRITKISLYSELLKRTISDQESGSSLYLKKISDISSNLSTGVKDFIWTLDPGKDSLYDVAIRLKDFGDDLFDKSGISFRTSGLNEKHQKLLMPMDWRRHIILIFKEAMNNILKYSNAENVLLSFKINDNEIDINLTDDGNGFDVDKIKSGRGLKNIRMRAASVNGKVDIQSSPKDGTSIHLHSTLP